MMPLKRAMNSKLEANSTLRWIVTWGSSVCGAIAVATLQSFRLPSSFDFSFFTVVAFLLGGGVFWAYWSLIFSNRRFRVLGKLQISLTAILVAIGLAGVLYPLRFVDDTERSQLLTGLITAAFALSGVGLLLLGCRWLFKDGDKAES